MPRVLASICVTVFLTVFFAVPLYAAMTICTMPCCHPTQTTISASMNGCGTECAVRADETTAAAARTLIPQSRTITVTAPLPSAIDVASEPRMNAAIERDTGPLHGDAPLHVLNSIFRI